MPLNTNTTAPFTGFGPVALTRIVPLGAFTLGLMVSAVYGGPWREYALLAGGLAAVAFVTATVPRKGAAGLSVGPDDDIWYDKRVMPRRAVSLVLLANAVSLAALAAWAKAGWPGRPNHLLFGNAFYCEAIRDGWIKQPANTWSCLGFIAVGLWLAARARSWRGAVLALFVSLIGPGSMALHASMTSFGGGLDVASMFLFIGFAAIHNAARLTPFLEKNFKAFLVAACAVLIPLGVRGHESGPALFAALIAAFLAGEALVALKGLGATRDRRRLAAAAALFFSGYGCWLLSEKSAGPWCRPYSPWQGHAAWHLLCALAAGAIYWYLEPELA